MGEKKVPCQVWSRTVGYLRPVDGWNVAKKLEFKQRKTYKIDLPALSDDTNFKVKHATEGRD